MNEEHCYNIRRTGGHTMVSWYKGNLFFKFCSCMYLIGKKKMFPVMVLELFYFL